MKSILTILLLCVLFTGCAKRPVGIADFQEVTAISDAFILKSDASRLMAHTDKSGVPSKTMDSMKEVLGRWKGPPPAVKHLRTDIMTLAEYDALNKEEDKDLPEWMRSRPPALRWNIQPDKLIVYTFVSKDPNDKASVRFFSGVFERGGLWYFACIYPKDS